VFASVPVCIYIYTGIFYHFPHDAAEAPKYYPDIWFWKSPDLTIHIVTDGNWTCPNFMFPIGLTFTVFWFWYISKIGVLLGDLFQPYKLSASSNIPLTVLYNNTSTEKIKFSEPLFDLISFWIYSGLTIFKIVVQYLPRYSNRDWRLTSFFNKLYLAINCAFSSTCWYVVRIRTLVLRNLAQITRVTWQITQTKHPYELLGRSHRI